MPRFGPTMQFGHGIVCVRVRFGFARRLGHGIIGFRARFLLA